MEKMYSIKYLTVEAVALELAAVSWQLHGVMLFGTFDRDGISKALSAMSE